MDKQLLRGLILDELREGPATAFGLWFKFRVMQNKDVDAQDVEEVLKEIGQEGMIEQRPREDRPAPIDL